MHRNRASPGTSSSVRTTDPPAVPLPSGTAGRRRAAGTRPPRQQHAQHRRHAQAQSQAGSAPRAGWRAPGCFPADEAPAERHACGQYARHADGDRGRACRPAALNAHRHTGEHERRGAERDGPARTQTPRRHRIIWEFFPYLPPDCDYNTRQPQTSPGAARSFLRTHRGPARWTARWAAHAKTAVLRQMDMAVPRPASMSAPRRLFFAAYMPLPALLPPPSIVVRMRKPRVCDAPLCADGAHAARRLGLRARLAYHRKNPPREQSTDLFKTMNSVLPFHR